jgi:predicted glycoside hydrolase/deacetylase ChbG (UPF0249 family)
MIICADDYGLDSDINDAILALVRSRRLTAVSCMVLLERCTRKSVTELLDYRSEIDIGLHLCLTREDLPAEATSPAAGQTARLPSFKALIYQAMLGHVQPENVQSQVAAQYELFVEKCGRRPDYLDGHLHAHQLPGVRRGLLNFVLSLPVDGRPYIRNTKAPLKKIWSRRLPWVKAAAIGAFGSQIYREIRLAGLSTNEGFAGIYDFRRGTRYCEYLPAFMQCLNDRNGILVVHPGHREDWRRREFAALNESTFAAGVLNRFLAERKNAQEIC